MEALFGEVVDELAAVGGSDGLALRPIDSGAAH